MSIRNNLSIVDDQDNIIREGDAVILRDAPGYRATVVSIFGNPKWPNAEIEFSTGAREIAFGSDIRAVS